MRKTIFFLILMAVVGLNKSNAQGCSEPASKDGINLFGYLQTQYNYNMYDKTESTFEFNRARIGVQGKVPYDFSYYFLLEASPFKKGAPNVYLLDAFITYERFSNAKLSIGSFKSPFSLELSTACSGLHTINRSRVVNELTEPDRDMGLMLLGGSDSTLLRYSVALMNGAGLLKKDADNYKDVVGRLIVQPAKWIHLGGSFKYGKSENENPTLGDNKRTRLGAEVQMNYANFLLEGEYIYGSDEGSYTVGGGCGGTPEVLQGNIKRSGMFMTLLYNTPWNLQPVVKYENYNSNLDLDKNMEQVTTFGINYFFNDWTRLQINYEYAAEQKKEIKNDRLMVQLQVKF